MARVADFSSRDPRAAASIANKDRNGKKKWGFAANLPRSIFLNRDSRPFLASSRMIGEKIVAWGILPLGHSHASSCLESNRANAPCTNCRVSSSIHVCSRTQFSPCRNCVSVRPLIRGPSPSWAAAMLA
jgi:hypothetical protein